METHQKDHFIENQGTRKYKLLLLERQFMSRNLLFCKL